MIQLIESGQTLKSYGVHGEIKVELDEKLEDFIRKEKVLFLYLDGNPVPFFIERIRNENPLLIKFEDINSPEQAKELSNKTIYVDKLKLSKKLLSSLEIAEQDIQLLHYACHDLTSGIISSITQIEEYPGQLMATLQIGEKTCLVPLHQDWIEKIDHRKKIIYLYLPEGILQL